MGVAVADFENHGRPDLFVTGVRENILYYTIACVIGTFEDVTARRGCAVMEAVGGRGLVRLR